MEKRILNSIPQTHPQRISNDISALYSLETLRSKLFAIREKIVERRFDLEDAISLDIYLREKKNNEKVPVKIRDANIRTAIRNDPKRQRLLEKERFISSQIMALDRDIQFLKDRIKVQMMYPKEEFPVLEVDISVEKYLSEIEGEVSWKQRK